VVRRAAPLTKVLAGYAQKSLPSAQLAGRLLTNLRDTGFTSNLLRFFYDAAAASARFDDVSHILPAHISVTPCALYATTPVAGCRATYTDVEAHPRRRRARREAPRPATASAPQPQAPAAAAGPAPPAPTTTPVPPPPPPLAPAGDAVKRLLDYLLK
jgi:hypothetical protein